MYFGEAAQIYYLEESKRLDEYLHSEILDNEDLSDLDEKKMKRIISKLKQEHDKKKAAYACKLLIESALSLIAIQVGGLVGAASVGVGAVIILIGFIGSLVNLIIAYKDAGEISENDFRNISNRIDKKIAELKKNHADKKVIAQLEKIYDKVNDYDDQETIHKSNVNVYY